VLEKYPINLRKLELRCLTIDVGTNFNVTKKVPNSSGTEFIIE